MNELNIAQLNQNMEKEITSNQKKFLKELFGSLDFSLPKKGAVLDGEIISVSLSNILVDLGPLGCGIVYPKEFYDDEEKRRSLKPGQKVKVVLLELENEDGFRELSLKKAQIQSSWQTIKELYEKGEIINVKIANLNKGGLITEIAGIQAFMPLSQLTEKHYPKVENGAVQEIVRILQTYRNKEFKVKIIDFDQSQNKLIISEKAAYQALLKEKAEKYKIGDVIEGEIREVTDFGAFIYLEEDLEALIPKSEVVLKGNEDIKEVLKQGEKIKAKIIQITPDKIVLSLKDLPE